MNHCSIFLDNTFIVLWFLFIICAIVEVHEQGGNMRHFIRVILSLGSTIILTFTASIAVANDFAAVLGVRTNSWDYSQTGSGASASGETSFQLGVLGFVDVAAAMQFRTGFLYTQRTFTASAGDIKATFTHSYFDIPATLLFKFSEYGGVFGGAVLALNASKSCSGGACSTVGVKSSLVGYQFGASFKFAPQLGAELYYEAIPGTIQTDGSNSFKDSKSVVANLLFTFE
jgi:hypothetical protein